MNAVTQTKVMDFACIKAAVAKQFERMQKHPMFRVGSADNNELWSAYLGAFPPGSNPIYRERTEHDCSCCKHFIRTVGDVVAIINGQVETIWDVRIPEEPAYQAVCNVLSKLVRERRIEEPFLHYERHAGTDRNFEQVTEGAKTWTHFFVNIAPNFVKEKHTIAPILAEQRATHDVLRRSLKEISINSIDTVLEMIAQGSLYRGEEHKHALQKFRALKVADNVTNPDQGFTWLTVLNTDFAVSRIRNTVIGTLLVDLSEDRDLEAAVAAYESKVAPTNYKRPTALVTKAMIEKARVTVENLGLTSALERRHARLADITVNNILWRSATARRAMTGTDVFDELKRAAGDRIPKTIEKVDEVPIDRFITEILPRAESVEVLLENRHQGNLVSLIAPMDATSGRIFKWPNNFSWSYAGEVTDSIKERVKQAGGSVVGDLCCRLAWSNYDDLDFHMFEPRGGHIYFGNRNHISPCGGKLDVDMNAGGGTTREPVENIFYATAQRMMEGTYKLAVNQYCKRDMKDPGFEVQFDWQGNVLSFAYPQDVKQGESILVAEFTYSKARGVEVVKSLASTPKVRNVWGLATQTFHPVTVAMLSPNCWDGFDAGNKHYFFMLENCANDDTARGFFNEFLKQELGQHRKVFEVLGAKMKVPPASEQLSGLGFSSTQKNTLTCRVKGSYTRVVNVVF